MTPGSERSATEARAAWLREQAEGARLRRWVLFWLAAFWILVFQIVFPPAPRLVWNASASMPVGLYWVSPGAQARRGDTVIARLPPALRRLAAERRYLPENVPLVKRVAAASGDRVCALGARILVDGKPVASRFAADRLRRPMPWWQGCRTLGTGELFLLMASVPDSFDGRYFGVSKASDLLGRAYPLWTR